MAGMHSMDSDAAHDYITDPLIASQPIDETGLNSHFTSTFAKHQPSVETAPAPDTLSNENNNLNRPHANDNATHRHSRGASLGERYPGDMSHRPLDTLKQENKTAHRSPHLRKKQIPGVDMIDGLDSVPGGRYHHEGPFDATLLSRNLNVQNSPVAAVARSNRDALKATPREKIQDAVQRHMPLDGVAAYPPGESDEFGRVYSYEETNLMADQGKVQKISVDEYNDDAKIDRGHHGHERYEIRDGSIDKAEASGTELDEHPHQKKHVEIQQEEVDSEHPESSKRHSLGNLKRRIGSLRKKKD